MLFTHLLGLLNSLSVLMGRVLYLINRLMCFQAGPAKPESETEPDTEVEVIEVKYKDINA